jgi:hypothetical protein
MSRPQPSPLLCAVKKVNILFDFLEKTSDNFYFEGFTEKQQFRRE